MILGKIGSDKVVDFGDKIKTVPPGYGSGWVEFKDSDKPSVGDWVVTEDGEWKEVSPEEDIISRNIEKSKSFRDSLSVSNIVVLGVEWQVRDKDRGHMQDAISTAEREGYPPDATIGWILADNTVRQTTAEELGQVLTAYSERLQSIFSQYTLWYNGDKLTPFEVS